MSKKLKVLRVLSLYLLFLLLLGLGGRFFVFDYTARIIGELLFELVQINDQSKYQINNAKFSYFPIEKHLLIEGLHLYPSRYNEDSTTRYDIRVPELYIGVESLIEVYFDKKLTITDITLQSPHLEIDDALKLRRKAERELTTEATDLYSILSNYLRNLKVNAFELKNGSLAYSQDSVMVTIMDDYSLKVSNFSMDPINLDGHQSVFYTEAIELSTSQQEFQLENSGHLISFDSLYYSSADSTFKLHNITIVKDYPNEKKDSLHVRIVSLDQIDLNDFFDKKTIDMGIITLYEPYLFGDRDGTLAGRKTGTNIINTSNYDINIDSIIVDNGNIDIRNEEVSMIARQMYLQKGAYLIPPNVDLFDTETFMKSTNFSCRPLNIEWQDLSLFSDVFEAYGSKKAFKFSGLKFEQIDEKKEIEIQSSSLTMSAFVYENNLVKADLVDLHRPRIRYYLKETNESDTLNSKSALGYELGKLKLNSADLSIYSPKMKVRVKNVNLFGSGLSDDLGYENMKNLRFSSGKTSINLDTLSFSAQSTGYNIKRGWLNVENLLTEVGSIDRLGVYNIDLPYLNRNKSFLADTLIIKGANLNLTQKSDSSTQKTFVLPEHKYIKILESDLTLNGDSIEMNLNNLNLFVDQEDVIDSLFLSSSILEKGDLKLNTQKIAATSKDESVLIGPTTITKGTSGSFSVDSIGLDIRLSLKDLQSVDSLREKFEEVVLFSPVIDISLQQEEKGRAMDTGKRPALKILNGKFNLITEDSKVSIEEAYADLKASKGGKSFLESLEEDAFQLKNISFKKENSELQVSSILYENGIAIINQFMGSSKEKAKMNIEELKIVHPDFASLEQQKLLADSIFMQGGNIELELAETEKKDSVSLEQFVLIPFTDISDFDFNIDTENGNLVVLGLDLQIDSINYSKDFSDIPVIMTLSGDSVHYVDQVGLKMFSFGDFKYNEEVEFMSMNNFSYEPLISKQEFMLDKEVEIDWITNSTQNISLSGFDLNFLLNEKAIQARNLTITRPDLYVYRDKRLADPVELKPLFHVFLANQKDIFNVDTIVIENGNIRYDEKSVKERAPAAITFTDLNGKIVNVFTNNDKIVSRPNLSLSATGKIMGTALFTTDALFDTRKGQSTFFMTGNVGSMDMTKLNSVLENSGHVRINSGLCRQMEFEFNADDDYAVGSMRFFYDKLHVNILNKENQKKGFGAAFKTFFANTFVVNRKNPHFIFLRKGDIYTERLKNRATFNYWSRALLSGMVSSIGARNNKKEIRKLQKSRSQAK